MTKFEYLAALEKALKSNGVRDCADILEEYAEHFDMKLADGFGEEEIAARLGAPKEIAAQFEATPSEQGGKVGNKIISAMGLVLADIIVGSLFLILYVWVVVLGVISLAVLGSGVMALIGQGVVLGVTLIPYMPLLSALLLGVMFLALAVLAAIGTEYCRLYTMQLFRIYARWHKAIWHGREGMLPIQKHPAIAPKKRRIMRGITLIALVLFIITLIAGLGSMILAAGSFEPWHVWNWFR